MDSSQKKNGNPVLFFLAVSIVIIIITLVANLRSNVATEILIPLNNGIVFLSTCENLLSAISNDNRIYIWEWTGLSKKPREFAVEDEQSVFLAHDGAVSLRRTRPAYIIVSQFDRGKQIKIPLPLGSDLGYLGFNGDRSNIFLLLARGDKMIKYELLEVLVDSEKVRPVITFDSEQSRPGNISVSDDGRYIVVAGEKKKCGWMAVLDAKEGRLAWQKEMPDFKKIFRAVFSIDGKTIYARGTDSTLLVIETNSGEITDRLLPIEENKSTDKVQAAQTVAVSGDGKLAAATVYSTIFVWDTRTKKKLSEFASGHKVISSITFSDDSRFLATSDMRQGGKIRILKMPQTGN